MTKFTLDTSDFNSLDDELNEDFNEAEEEVITNVYVDLTDAPPTGTPVDTGKARLGWQIDTTPGQMEIYNREKHIGALNDGHSKQTPAGFVERAILKHAPD